MPNKLHSHDITTFKRVRSLKLRHETKVLMWIFLSLFMASLYVILWPIDMKEKLEQSSTSSLSANVK